MGVLRDWLFPNQYRYFDSPEGEDCSKKLIYVTQNCAVYGVLGSSIDILLYSHPKGYAAVLGRYAYITLPFMGMGAAFVMATCMATNMRKKDDIWNYFIGGYAAGGVMGAWKKSLKVGIYGGAALAFFGLLQKDCIQRNWKIFTSEDWAPRSNGNIWSAKRDFTILQDPGRTWKISENE